MASPYVAHGDELRLSNPAQLELLRGCADRGAAMRSTVRGRSMAPFIRGGDVLTIAPFAGRELRVGDVVAFCTDDGARLAIHRVVARSNEQAWLLRGDSVGHCDGVVSMDRILGRVVRVERGGGDVRLGLGPERTLVAALSRHGVLWVLLRLGGLPRRAATASLRCAQGLTAYRAVARQLVPPPRVGQAGAAERRAVRRRLDPQGAQAENAPDPNVTDLVACRGGRVVGYVQHVVHPAGGPWAGHWLFTLTVWPLHRGSGVGEALVRSVVEDAHAAGAPQLLLAVFPDAERAVRLYRKLGFEPVTIPELEPVFEEEMRTHGRRRVVMRKSLGVEGAADGL